MFLHIPIIFVPLAVRLFCSSVSKSSGLSITNFVFDFFGLTLICTLVEVFFLFLPDLVAANVQTVIFCNAPTHLKSYGCIWLCADAHSIIRLNLVMR